MPKKPQSRPAPKPAPAAAAHRKAPAKELAHIVDGLRPLAVPVAELRLDPRNARQHGDRSIEAIARSLDLYQQRKPIVVNRETKTVIAGNGTLAAIQQRGWGWVAAVMVDDDATTATGYAIADNRTAELSSWNNEQLQELLGELEESGVLAIDVGFSDSELQQMIQQATAGVDAGHQEQDAPDQSGLLRDKWQVVVDCKDEQDQIDFLALMRTNGRKTRVLNS